MNVVLVLCDDLDSTTAKDLPTLACAGIHPNWISFPNFVINTSLCKPSRASILTGLYSHHHGVTNNLAAFNDSNTLANWLNVAGVRCGLVGKYVNDYDGSYCPQGWRGWTAKTVNKPYSDFTVVSKTLVPTVYGPNDYSTDVFRDKAVAFINNPSPDPFFLLLALDSPHKPCTPAARHLNATLPANPQPSSYNNATGVHPWFAQQPAATTADNAERDDARRTMFAVQEAIDAVMAALIAKGVLDDTVVMVTSDNGFHWGEHHYVGKQTPYEESAVVPLAVRHPTATAHVETRVVGNVDLASTICAFFNLAPVNDGKSFAYWIDPTKPQSIGNFQPHLLERQGATSPAMPNYWGLRTPAFKYVEWEDGRVEMYDLPSDEMTNVAEVPSYGPTRVSLAVKLGALKA